jgi:hypothetical protein
MDAYRAALAMPGPKFVGALELRVQPSLSSWTAYGPALASIVPSTILVLVASDALWRWASLVLVAVVILVVGLLRCRRASVVVGGEVLFLVLVTEMIRLLARGQLFGSALLLVLTMSLAVLAYAAGRRHWRRVAGPGAVL